MVERIKLSDDWEMDKSLSLNLEQRRARSERWDIGLFESENRRLVAKGEEPFADLAAWKDNDEEDEESGDDNGQESITENDQEDTLSSSSDQIQNSADVDTEDDTLNTEKDKNIAESDPMLFEAGKVLSEQIQLQTQALSQRLAAVKSNKESNL